MSKDLKSIVEENVELVKKQAVLRVKIDSMINNYENLIPELKSALKTKKTKKEFYELKTQIDGYEKSLTDLKTLTNE